MAISAATRRPWYRPMRAHDPHEGHRAATPLELFFDLCFVVAVALAAARLHHAIAEGHIREALPSYGVIFFAVWWAWLNFTWFASSYDTDDVPYRLATLIQIAGALTLAAGLPRVFDTGDSSIVVLGYVLMRVVMIVQWLRAAQADTAHRETARRYAIGITIVQVAWILRLFLPGSQSLITFVVLALAELAVPIWAERTGATPWHAGHVAERYSLFTLIVLGESILAATMAIQSAFDSGIGNVSLLITALSGLLVVFAMWWVYFDQTARILNDARSAFLWGYGHYFVFGAAAAVGAGIQVAIDTVTGVAHISTRAAGLASAIPIALYLISVWFLHAGVHQGNLARSAASPLAAALVLVAALTPWPLPAIAVVLAARVVVAVLTAPHVQAAHAHA